MVQGRRKRGDDGLRQQVHGTQDENALRELAGGAERTVDARNTFCPEPVIRTQNAARAMQPGEVAMVLADDAGVAVDIPAWCISTGNEFLGLLREPEFYRVFVRKR